VDNPKVEKKFQSRFTQKINESLIANNLAYDNHLRSLLSIAEQTAVHPSKNINHQGS
jgi:hypothetical protein